MQRPHFSIRSIVSLNLNLDQHIRPSQSRHPNRRPDRSMARKAAVVLRAFRQAFVNIDMI